MRKLPSKPMEVPPSRLHHLQHFPVSLLSPTVRLLSLFSYKSIAPHSSYNFYCCIALMEALFPALPSSLAPDYFLLDRACLAESEPLIDT